MNTFIYMIRHGESPKTGEDERGRGLTEKGRADASTVTRLLKGEGIGHFFSSPYTRAILTIRELAEQAGQEIMVKEELRELVFSGEKRVLSDMEMYPSIKRMFSEPGFSLPGGETAAECQNRSVGVVKQILETYRGQRVAIGTHGMVMTLTMGYFDSRFGLEFLIGISRPDVYRLEFDGERLVEVRRLWEA
ncbi:MAG: hypothetical protein K0R57_4151 [Paenibacillaceae bacterium]|jgi:2,3-bisphosphoglycerate-dependent phosphoglycerate mutase|nr:hypothetical protein [Paenibacillaceae bacterium]